MSPAASRTLDAAENRAREALRTMEDLARFACDDADLSAALKTLRHDFSNALRPLSTTALLHRDTPGDVGTTLSTPSETSRSGMGDVAMAAGRRAGEALRSVEEVLKTGAAGPAAAVEAMRYRLYTLERRLVLRTRPAGRFAGVRVYVLITKSCCRHDWRTVAREAIVGGAGCLQLREPTLDDRDLFEMAKTFVSICHELDALAIVNNRADVAALADADGVHLGQTDLSADAARRIVGPDAVVGVSTHDVGQVHAACAAGADYVGVGPAYPSVTKPRAFLPGLPFLRDAATETRVPTVAIGGISADGVQAVWETGVSAVAVTAAVCASDDPAAAVRSLLPPDA